MARSAAPGPSTSSPPGPPEHQTRQPDENPPPDKPTPTTHRTGSPTRSKSGTAPAGSPAAAAPPTGSTSTTPSSTPKASPCAPTWPGSADATTGPNKPAPGPCANTSAGSHLDLQAHRPDLHHPPTRHHRRMARHHQPRDVGNHRSADLEAGEVGAQRGARLRSIGAGRPRNDRRMNVFLETERLVLRELTDDDVDDLVELDADPEVLRWTPDEAPSRDEVETSTCRTSAGSTRRRRASGSGRPRRRRPVRSSAGSTCAPATVTPPTSRRSGTGYVARRGARGTQPRAAGH